MKRIPTHRSPTHPGTVLAEDFLAEFGITQVDLAERIGVPFQRINQIVNAKRAVTPDTALRFAQLFGTTAEFWLNLRQAWDLSQSLNAPEARQIGRIKPLARARKAG